MATKKRKYVDDYIEFGFVSLLKGDTEVPQCVICYKTLSNDAMHPSRLKRHLTTAHSALAKKPKAFFVMKSHSLKKAKLGMSGRFSKDLRMLLRLLTRSPCCLQRIRKVIISGNLL